MDATNQLFDAVRKGNVAEVEKLLDGDPALLGARRSGVSALLFAVYVGHPEIARIFLERGADPDVFEASATGEVGALEKLLAEDPSCANAVAADGFTPLGLASFFRHRDAVRLLIARGALVNMASQNAQRVAPLHSAVAGGDEGIVADLLAHGADVEARQEFGFTPLHNAATEGNETIIRLLLDHGADRSARSDSGKTPEDIARDRGRSETAELLRAEAASS
ncbi:MAG: ankyrin repeat domain-containing protein [Acidobacteriota bacterium]|nr:ankyrin repeat domain-containing protein [Acidobacteriota bacterium]MDQ5871272.1 ankyrin repeat domain-containing protein [Acidobacteriota bacterium]